MKKIIKSLVLISTIMYFLSYMTFLSAGPTNMGKNKLISFTDAGQGRPIVLIHAFPTDHRLWDPQQVLKKYFRIITLDLWGFGHSEKTNGQAISMSEYADEVKQLLDQLHLKKAIVGGESMGGYIALSFLEKYSDKVEGLILSDTQSIADTSETKVKREEIATDVLEHGTANLIDGFMPRALSSTASESLRNSLRRILETQSPAAVASALRGMSVRSDTSASLVNSEIPVLIITGDQDTVILPKQSENMRQLAKNSKLVVIKNAGHLSSWEKPEEWNQAVINMFYK